MTKRIPYALVVADDGRISMDSFNSRNPRNYKGSN